MLPPVQVTAFAPVMGELSDAVVTVPDKIALMPFTVADRKAVEPVM
jgi:hypothetical protein